MNLSEAKVALLKQIENVEPLSEESLGVMIDARREILTEEQLQGYKEHMEPFLGQRLIHYIRKRANEDNTNTLDLLFCGEEELDEVLEELEGYDAELGESNTMVVFSNI